MIDEMTTPEVLVDGKLFGDLPIDLYIPPHALQVFLASFSGPLDLLLYLTRKNHIDILNIPIAEITTQYMGYLDLMQKINLELAAEYLVMAAVLAEIKSKLLLPRPLSAENQDEDPRAELARKLREYERFKEAAEMLDELPRMQRDFFEVRVNLPEIKHKIEPLPLLWQELLVAFKTVLVRADLTEHHTVLREVLSVRERMGKILNFLHGQKKAVFTDLVDAAEGRLGIIVTFMATLELLHQGLVELVQAASYSDLYICLFETVTKE